MLNAVRFGGGLMGGIGAVAGSALGIFLAIVPPTDDEVRIAFLRWMIVVAAVTILGIVAFAVSEYLRDRKREQRDRERDGDVARILAKLYPAEEAVTAKQSVAVSPQRGTLRQAALTLVGDMRNFLARIPANASDEEQFDQIFEPFLKEYWPRLRDVKDRMENVVPNRWSITPSTEWLPTSRERVRRTVDALEREALQIPSDVPE